VTRPLRKAGPLKAVRRAAAVAAFAALAVPAGALGGEASISPSGNPAFPERTLALELPSKLALAPGDVQATENGVPVQGLEVTSAGEGGQGQFGTVLVIDASDSMRGEPINQAMRAAQAFAAHRTVDQELSVIVFNRDVEVTLPFTTSRAAISDALATTPTTAPQTHLYDAVDAGTRDLRDAEIANGSMVVLSDGRDNGSGAKLDDAIARAQEQGVRIFTVGLQSDVFDQAPLQALAVGGDYANAASPKDLAGIFNALGSRLASEYLLRYQSSAEPGQRVTVDAQVAGVSGSVRTSYVVPGGSPSASADSTKDAGFWVSTGAMVVASIVAAMLLVLAVLIVARPRQRTVGERLAPFIASRDAGSQAQALRAERRGLLGRLELALEGGARWERWREELDVARIERPAVEILAALIVVVSPYPVLGLAALLVPLGVHSWVRRTLRSERSTFANQLGDSLQVIASAIRAGHSMVSAFAVVIDEAAEPTKSEFRRIVNDERLGVPLEDATREVARRMQNRDLEQVALVATIQRETGGNTAEMLNRVVETIRERADLRRLMETLTAQGRLSRVIVTALPAALMAAIAVISPGYLKPLFETTEGNVFLIVGACLVVAGSVVIQRIVEIKV
jgi:tight adherence protein B